MLLVCVRIDHPPHSSRAGSSIQAILPYCLPTTPAYCLPTTSLLFINDSSRLFTNDPYVNMAYCLRIGCIPTTIGIGSGVLGFRPYWCPSPFPSLSIPVLGVFHSLNYLPLDFNRVSSLRPTYLHPYT